MKKRCIIGLASSWWCTTNRSSRRWENLGKLKDEDRNPLLDSLLPPCFRGRSMLHRRMR